MASNRLTASPDELRPMPDPPYVPMVKPVGILAPNQAEVKASITVASVVHSGIRLDKDDRLTWIDRGDISKQESRGSQIRTIVDFPSRYVDRRDSGIRQFEPVFRVGRIRAAGGMNFRDDNVGF